MNDKFDKQDEKLETINALIANHNDKIDKKIENSYILWPSR